MKKLTYLLIATFTSLAFVSCSNNGMKVVTREDGDAGLSNYDTYAWLSEKQNIPSIYALVGPDEALIFNNESSQKMIKEAIELQLAARGFKKDNRNPEMLINFNILEDETELRKYILDNGQDYLGFGPRSESVQMIPVDEGTVLINFLDSKSGNQIWQGYASGALEEKDIENKTNLENKVGAIFEDFDFNQFDTNSQ
ncbi:DUF4136 domain-containing protein [Algoriphagus aestuarii]|nr:DUF4136 domain-containing protein [Algoriphagus aestuarii]